MTYDIRDALRRQIELEDEQRTPGASRYHSRQQPWKAKFFEAIVGHSFMKKSSSLAARRGQGRPMRARQ